MSNEPYYTRFQNEKKKFNEVHDTICGSPSFISKRLPTEKERLMMVCPLCGCFWISNLEHKYIFGCVPRDIKRLTRMQVNNVFESFINQWCKNK